MNQRVVLPPGCERLFDLIKCDDARLLTAFFWSVQNTLVCGRLDRAREVAYEGAGGAIRRTVTLQACDRCLMPGGAAASFVVVLHCADTS